MPTASKRKLPRAVNSRMRPLRHSGSKSVASSSLDSIMKNKTCEGTMSHGKNRLHPSLFSLSKVEDIVRSGSAAARSGVDSSNSIWAERLPREASPS